VGHVAALRRLAVGKFTLDRAISLDELAGMDQIAALERLLLPIATALDDIPALALTEDEAHRLRHGQSVALLTRQDRERLGAARGDAGGDVVVFAHVGGIPVALVRVEGAEVRPVRVLNV
jgi:tRNA pseudouridine55 synthase